MDTEDLSRRRPVLDAVHDAWAQLVAARLNQKLGDRVKQVVVKRDYLSGDTLVAVVFKNGHILRTTSDAVLTKEFLASCLMVYDLPHIGRDEL